MVEILLVAVSLAMDSFSSSIVCGSLIESKKDIRLLTIPLSLGIFHILTPLLGWGLGAVFEVIVSSTDHWIAFFLLSIVGVKMIYGALKPPFSQKDKLLNGFQVLALSIATSIDAFVVGVSFAFMNINIIKASFIIGIVNYLLSTTGMVIGRKVKKLVGRKAEVMGGLVLIALGVKILIEHVFM